MMMCVDDNNDDNDDNDDDTCYLETRSEAVLTEG